MSFRNGLKWAAAACAAMSLAGCSSASQPAAKEEALKVLCPTGAPALATLGLEMSDADVEYVEGQDLLVSELAKKDGDYDLIAAPVNLGVKTWKESEAYQLDGILTWGNLYIVAQNSDWNTEGSTLALFGENAVPGLVFDSLYAATECNTEYYPSAAEASQALLAGKADAALLAQPAAAGAIAKGAENGLELSPVADLQQLWQDSHESANKGYPQAALFVRRGTDPAAANKLIEEYIETATPEKVETDIDAVGPDKLGVPNAKIAAKTWDAQNIHFKKASEVKDEINSFLSVFGIELPEGLILE